MESRVVLAPNPGPMTLGGTNSYVLAAGPLSGIIIDPGPADAGHLAALADASPELILITHHHADHTAGSAELHRVTGAPVRAIDPAQCHGGEPLRDGELIEAAGIRIRVLATPGHTDDSACFVLPDAILTGDTILGSGTTVVDGSLAQYLDSLRALRRFGSITVLPGHGPERPSLVDACDALIAHRQMRLTEVRAAVSQLGADATVTQVTDAVYADIDPAVRFAAELSVQAQLDYLRSR